MTRTLAHGARELRLGLLQRHLGVGAVQPHQLVAGLDEIGVVGAHRDHRAGDLRRHLHDVAADIGVVRGLRPAAGEPPPAAPDADADEKDEEDRDNRRPALAVGCRCLFHVQVLPWYPPPSAARQADRRFQPPRPQVGGQHALRVQLRFRAEHGEVIGESRAVAREREIVGRLGGGERRRDLGVLALDGAEGGELVGDFAQRVGERPGCTARRQHRIRRTCCRGCRAAGRRRKSAAGWPARCPAPGCRIPGSASR